MRLATCFNYKKEKSLEVLNRKINIWHPHMYHEMTQDKGSFYDTYLIKHGWPWYIQINHSWPWYIHVQWCVTLHYWFVFIRAKTATRWVFIITHVIKIVPCILHPTVLEQWWSDILASIWGSFKVKLESWVM